MLPQSPVVAPPAAPAPAAAPSPDLVRPGNVYVDGKPLTSPQAIYSGYVHQREELINQLRGLNEARADITRELNGDNPVSAIEKAGLEKRLASVDARIEAMDKQIAAADAQVASAAAIPGAVVDPPPIIHNNPEEQPPFILGVIFMFVAVLPMSLAFARRIWRRSPKAVALPSDMAERFAQLDHAVESIAVEVERIGEGQRFITRVLAEPTSRAALGASVAEKAEPPQRSMG